RSKATRSVSRSTTVRQTPLTAIDAPTSESDATFGAETTRRSPEDSTIPTSSMIPVNIRHHLHVVAHAVDRPDRDRHGLGDRRDTVTTEHSGGTLPPDQLRRQVEHEPVHHTGVDRPPRELRAALDQDVLDLPLPQPLRQ